MKMVHFAEINVFSLQRMVWVNSKPLLFVLSERTSLHQREIRNIFASEQHYQRLPWNISIYTFAASILVDSRDFGFLISSFHESHSCTCTQYTCRRIFSRLETEFILLKKNVTLPSVVLVQTYHLFPIEEGKM